MLRPQISSAFSTFPTLPLSQAALVFWQTLGYHSDLRLEGLPTDATGFAQAFGIADTFRPDKAFATSWKSVHFLFQVTGEEVTAQNSLFQGGFDKARSDSYLFFAVELEAESYSRGTLVQITRELNRPFQSPILVLFKYGQKLTLAIVDRRASKRDVGRDVLEKVTLIKDISLVSPHPAHLRILEELELPKLRATNWDELHAAWRKVLDLSELNKKFYRELSDWFFWARNVVRFPAATTEQERSVAVIRLITRTMFAYFIKERGLVPKVFFEPDQFSKLLKDTSPRVSTYYNGILQNLFFAALNAEPSARGWQDEIQESEGNESYSDTYLDSSKRRYRELFVNPDAARELLDSVPFLNGGLFECLDTRNVKTRTETRHDGFSSKEPKRAFVPNYLFWGDEQPVDLNSIYQTKSRSYSVRPLLEILNRYKFTVAENTPLEEEVALDPELLGKVFENLLASYNPETETTARKQTGSFYTPREIVDYMVEESVLAYLEGAVTDDGAPKKDVLRELVSYDADAPKLNLEQRQALIKAVGSVTILDPACGSGAFPMGCLHRLTWILGRLDPDDGALWKAEQQRQINSLDMPEAREAAQARFDEAVARDGGDYVRKLYLIERCLFGVDIQPIAVQISKLRFFISLIVDQQLDPKDPAKDVQPLPNLETKFVAANTLLRPNAGQLVLKSDAARLLEKDLFEVRRRHFSARKWSDKRKFREEDERLRTELAEELILTGMPEGDAHKMADWNPYDQSSSSPFFDIEWMFGPTFRGGFNIVIANPPYGSDIDSLSRILGQMYPNTTKKFKEIYKIFIEAAMIGLVKKQGVMVYIIPNTLLRQPRYQDAREFLLRFTLDRVLNLGEGVFEQVVVPTCVIFVVNKKSENSYVQYTDMTSNSKFLGIDNFYVSELISPGLIPRRLRRIRMGCLAKANDSLRCLVSLCARLRARRGREHCERGRFLDTPTLASASHH